MATRRSPLESLVKRNEEGEEEQGGRSLFLRGWLTEAETAEVFLSFSKTAFFCHAAAITRCWHSVRRTTSHCTDLFLLRDLQQLQGDKITLDSFLCFPLSQIF